MRSTSDGTRGGADPAADRVTDSRPDAAGSGAAGRLESARRNRDRTTRAADHETRDRATRAPASRARAPRRQLSSRQAAQRAARQVFEMAGHQPQKVISLAKDEGGWDVGIEVVELHRIPDIDAGAFGDQAVQRTLSDPAELEMIARAHHGVVAAAAAAGPALPLRLGTIYTSDDRVRALLAEQRAKFTEMLRWLDGRTEYGVKVWADPRVLAAGHRPDPVTPAPATAGPAEQEEPAAAQGNGTPGPSSGTAYLLRRRASLSARDDSWQHAVTRAEEIHAALGQLALAARRHAPQDARTARESGGWMILNGAYLVDSNRVPEFTAAVTAMAGPAAGFRLEVTGPWPPYSFTDGLGE